MVSNVAESESAGTALFVTLGAKSETTTYERGGSELPTVTGGMLHFDSHEKFDAFVKMLERKESDRAHIKSAYSKLGIDTESETIPNLTQLLFISTGGVACQSSKPYFANCGEKKTAIGNRIFEFCNERWKLDAAIWVKTGEVGCEVKYLRWRGALLGWLPANNEGSCADLSGIYIREEYNPDKNCAEVAPSGSTCLGNGTYPTTIYHNIAEVPEVFAKPNQLSAGLGIKICGVWHGWGYGGKPATCIAVVYSLPIKFNAGNTLSLAYFLR
jgi:hypothetical protein